MAPLPAPQAGAVLASFRPGPDVRRTGRPVLWRVPINEIDFAAKLQGPSWAHPLGTDDLGQDLLAR
jgi:ABC-type dipeptide/oligopeptide/nickel transport system permease subunit